MAGVGDSDPDLSYLRHVGLSAAPKNATPGVQQGVEYVARAAYGEGLLEILTMLERRNRQAHA
jgi:3-deoxy-D-manno-octulosonate 8-phosphate phosphatase KdsC-like HAD superfamily phosphatase